MRERVQYAAALVLELVGAGAALLISARPWQSVLTPRPRPFRDDLLHVSGRTLDAAPTALALVALAGVVAVLATRGWPRRLVGLIVALAGGGLVWRSLEGLRALGPARARTLVTDHHPGVQLGVAVPHIEVHGSWPVLSALCGVLVILAGALIAARGHRWGAMSAKYDAPAAEREPAAGSTSSVTPAVTSGEDAERERLRANAALWSALDRGDDPTGPDR